MLLINYTESCPRPFHFSVCFEGGDRRLKVCITCVFIYIYIMVFMLVQAVVNMVMNLRFHKRWEIFLSR
jgi:hypothetical protein